MHEIIIACLEEDAADVGDTAGVDHENSTQGCYPGGCIFPISAQPQH